MQRQRSAARLWPEHRAVADLLLDEGGPPLLHPEHDRSGRGRPLRLAVVGAFDAEGVEDAADGCVDVRSDEGGPLGGDTGRAVDHAVDGPLEPVPVHALVVAQQDRGQVFDEHVVAGAVRPVAPAVGGAVALKCAEQAGAEHGAERVRVVTVRRSVLYHVRRVVGDGGRSGEDLSPGQCRREHHDHPPLHLRLGERVDHLGLGERIDRLGLGERRRGERRPGERRRGERRPGERRRGERIGRR